MRVIVQDDTGNPIFWRDSSGEALFPSEDDKSCVKTALGDAIRFLGIEITNTGYPDLDSVPNVAVVSKDQPVIFLKLGDQ